MVRFAAQIALASAAAVRYRAALGRAIDAFDPAIVHTNGLKMHVLGAWGIGPSRRPGLVWHLHDYLGTRRMTTRLLRWHHGAARPRSSPIRRVLPPMRHARWPTALASSRSGTAWTSIAFR